MAFRNVRCVIIDEVSMMSADQLEIIDILARHITQKYGDTFGGLHMILCGDLRQLPPFGRARSANGPGAATELYAEEFAL